jgi:16S rRNA (cytosine967-C5)-methyltransferase
MRLRPIFERLKRAGARNVQVLPAGDHEGLAKLAGKMDVVLIDAPCSGSGVWRRRPDAKWRLSPSMLEARRGEQTAVLEEGAGLVKPGGRLAYITCSVLPSRIATGWTFSPAIPISSSSHGPNCGSDRFRARPCLADGSGETLLMTPRDHGTDGFFVAVMQRSE